METGPARARPLHGPVPRRTARLGTRPPTETRAASPGLPGVPGPPAEGTSERLGHGRARARAPAHFTADFFLFKYGDFDPLLPRQRRPLSGGTLRTVACAQTARVRRTSRPAPRRRLRVPRLPAREAGEDASRRKRAPGSSVLVRTRRGVPLCPCVRTAWCQPPANTHTLLAGTGQRLARRPRKALVRISGGHRPSPPSPRRKPRRRLPRMRGRREAGTPPPHTHTCQVRAIAARRSQGSVDSQPGADGFRPHPFLALLPLHPDFFRAAEGTGRSVKTHCSSPGLRVPSFPCSSLPGG